MQQLRRFLYLDRKLVATYLEQLEGAHYDSEKVREVASRDTSVGGDVGVRSLRATGKKGRVASNESEIEYRQTDSSRFARLYDLLDEKRAVQELNALDDEIWEQLKRGEILDIQAQISLPAVAKLLDLTARLEPLVGLMGNFGEELDPAAGEAIAGMKALGEIAATRKTPIIAAVAGTPRFRFVCNLDRDSMLVEDPSELEGELNVLGVLQRKLSRGQRIAVTGPLDSLLDLMPSKDRQAAEREMRKAISLEGTGITSGGISVGFPGAVLTPVAVYI